MPNEFAGGCHCGAIGFDFRTAIEPPDWAIRACQCSFCRAHDAQSTSDPAGQISFVASRLESLQKYRFGLTTADFLLCRECGVYIGAVINSAGNAFGIVNVRALKKTRDDLANIAAISYDTEDVDSRVLRRAERWTPVIEVPKNR